MFFSVLVPVYNTAQYLHECVESILSQTFPDFELVLLNDGSTDESGTICDSFAARDSRVRVIHKENEGLMMTRRRGFSEAKGDYFICVDSDDAFCRPDALERIHNTIVSTGCDLVIYNYIYGAGGGRDERTSALLPYETGHLFEGDGKQVLYEKLLTGNNMNNMWIKCPARSVVDREVDYSQWKAQICRAEDLFQSYPMLTGARRVAYIAEPLYFYRWTPGSIGNKAKFRYYDSLRCIYDREAVYMDKWNISPQIRDKATRRQLEGYMTVIVKCYFTAKAAGTVDQWRAFARTVSQDPCFRDILTRCDRKKVLRYYRLLHSLLCRRCLGLAIAVMELTAAISARKHRRVTHA